MLIFYYNGIIQIIKSVEKYYRFTAYNTTFLTKYLCILVIAPFLHQIRGAILDEFSRQTLGEKTLNSMLN